MFDDLFRARLDQIINMKHTYALSDEQMWERWVHDPYFQYFTGEEFFQHELGHERSGMSHWRKRIGGKLARAHDVPLRQSYGRVARRAAITQPSALKPAS